MLIVSRRRFLLPGVGLSLLFALALALLRGAPVFAAGDRYVATTGVDAGACDNSASPCQTIAYAVAQAAAGDTIHIAAGSYTGVGNQHVVIAKALTLAGADAATTILTYDPLVQAVAGRDGILEIRASDVTVRDLTVRDAPIEGGVPLWAVRVWKDGGTLTNVSFDTVRFLNNAGRGLELHNNTTLNNLTITGSLFKDNPTHGIRLSSTTNVNGLTITHTTFENNGHSGLFQSVGGGYLTGLHIDNSTFTGNVVQAVLLGNAHDGLIENSTFSGGGRGIAFINLADTANAIGDLEIRHNTLSDFAGTAIWVDVNNTALDDPLTIANNTITQDISLLTTSGATIAVGLAGAKTHAAVDLIANDVTLAGVFGTATAAYGLKLAGGLTAVTISGNSLDGGNVGNNGGAPATSGLYLVSNSAGYGALNQSDSVAVSTNTITGFVNGISIYDEVSAAFGGLPVVNGLSIARNSIAGNSAFGVRGGPSTAAEATCNWWGAASGPSGQGPGTGDAVSTDVIFAPWLPNDDILNSLCGGVNDLFVGTNRGGSVGGVNFNDVDILALDMQTGTWSKFFEGKDVNVSTNLTGFTFEPGGCLLVTFDGNEKKLGLGMIIKPHDILKFCPTSLGETTTGTWSVYLDGSDVGLTTDGEKLDALELLPDGRILLSTKGNFAVKNAANQTITGRDEDVLVFDPTTLGANTTGSFAVYLDGSDIPGMVKEDITGLYYNPLNGDLHVTILGTFNVGGVAGDSNDIIILRPSGGGYTVLPYWNGTDDGWSYVLRSMHIDLP